MFPVANVSRVLGSNQSIRHQMSFKIDQNLRDLKIEVGYDEHWSKGLVIHSPGEDSRYMVDATSPVDALVGLGNVFSRLLVPTSTCL